MDEVRIFSDQRLQEIRTTLVKTYALLHDPLRHTRGTEARNAQGKATAINGREAVKFCLVGGVKRVVGGAIWNQHTTDVLEVLDTCALELYPPRPHRSDTLRPAAYVNDKKGHAAALRVLRCGVQKVRAELKRREQKED